MTPSEPADFPPYKILPPLGIAIALCLGAIIGGVATAIWVGDNGNYVSVGTFAVGSTDSKSSTQPTDSDIYVFLLDLNAPPFFSSVLAGKTYPAPSGTEGMSAADFATHVRIERIPGKPLIRVEYTAHHPQDAIAAVSAILQTYLVDQGSSSQISIGSFPSTPANPPYPVATVVEGTFIGAGVALILTVGYRAMKYRALS